MLRHISAIVHPYLLCTQPSLHMATAGDVDSSSTSPWTRSGFSNTFKRKGRKNKGSDSNSIASSGGVGQERRRSSVDGSFGRTSTNDTTRKLSAILSGSKRRGRKDKSESESSEALSRTATGDGSSALYSNIAVSDEGPIATEDAGNYTEDDDEAYVIFFYRTRSLSHLILINSTLYCGILLALSLTTSRDSTAGSASSRPPSTTHPLHLPPLNNPVKVWMNLSYHIFLYNILAAQPLSIACLLVIG